MRPTKNALLDALNQYGRAMAKKPAGEGWSTLQELSAQEGVSVPALKYRMDMARKRGLQFEMAPGTQLDDDGNARKAIYWRLKNGKPK